MEKIFNKRNAFFLVGFVVLFKLYLSAALELHPDEAYYWLWSAHLAPGYYDHSPMVAYFIKLTTIFSDSEIFVRFSSILVTVILSLLIWKFSKKLFNDESVASASVMAINTMPLMLVGSVIITPDTPLFLFWAFAVYFLWRLVETNQTKYWYITGLFFGLAMLSKYTGVLFAACLLAYMILDKKTGWMKNKHFYFMFIVSFAVFLPVIYWNWQNEWISFTYQFNHGLYNTKFETYVFEYLGSQALLAGPVIFVSGIIAAIAYLAAKDSKKTFIASFSLTVILFFALTALKKKPGANWPAFAYFTFSIMAVQYMLGSKNKKNILIIGIILNIIFSVILGLHAARGIIPIHKFSQKAAIADATNWFTGWKELGKNLTERDIKYAVTNSHQWGGAVAYYARGKVTAVLDNVPKNRFNQFAYWDIPEDLDVSKAAVVRIDNRMRDDFSAALPGAEVFFVYRNGIPVRQYAIAEVGGYQIKSDIKSVRQKH